MQITNIRKTKFAVVAVLLSLSVAMLFAMGCAITPEPLASEMHGSSEILPTQKSEENETDVTTDEVEESTAYEGWELTEADEYPFGEYATSDGEWIYYADNKNWELIRMLEDGSEKQRLTNGGAMHRLTIEDGWIYYLIIPRTGEINRGSNLCRIKTDGSQNQLLFEECYHYSLTDDEIFYTLMTTEYANGDGNDTDGIHELISQTYEMRKANLDGTCDTGFGISGSVIDAIGGWIYYAGGGGLSRISVGEGESELVADTFSARWPICEHNGWLYVSGYIGNAKTYVYKMRPDGSEMSLFAKSIGMSASDGYLYCYAYTGNNEVAIMSLESGTEVGKVFVDKDLPIGLFDVIGDWIYFIDQSTQYEVLWRVRLDGTGMEEL